MSTPIAIAGGLIAGSILTYVILAKDQKAESREEGMIAERADEIVIYYRLRQDECPGLFENLAAVPKGQPRASRLKVLALRGFNADRLTRRSTEQTGLPDTPKPQASRKHIHPI